jgi:hypothetical protein
MDANVCDGLYVITNIKTTAQRETKGKLKGQRYVETPFGENPTLDYSTTARIYCKTNYCSSNCNADCSAWAY